ncbi:MAG: glycosyltransferase family 4 protein [Candidatus Cloacimonetes bacterium]|nr:glycosyltransferase family 4 protein [Candidatus Cloacimonadota bacterium]
MRTKILYLDHAPYEGGAEVSLKDLLKNLDRNRFKSILVCPKDTPSAKELTSAGVRAVNFNYHWTAYKFVFPLLYDFIKLIGLIRREKPQIIHTNTRVTNILGGFLKFYYTLHPAPCTLISHIRDRDPLPWWKFKLIGSADFLIANSQKTKDFLVDGRVSPKKIKVVYNGIDLQKFNPLKCDRNIVREKLGITDRQKVIATIGQIYPRKGIPFLIKAVKGLAIGKAVGEVKLLIVGSDPTPDQRNLTLFKSLISELGLENKVEFLGYREDIPEILAATDIFVLPSLEEPFGRVLIEAMAMKVPVVASNVGGIPEIVDAGRSGFLIPPKDSQALAEKLLILLKNDKMREGFGSHGRKIVEEKFTLEKHVGRVEGIYSNLQRGRTS